MPCESFDSRKQRYLNDPKFRRLVDALTSNLIDGLFTAHDMRDAIAVAEMQYERWITGGA